MGNTLRLFSRSFRSSSGRRHAFAELADRLVDAGQECAVLDRGEVDGGQDHAGRAGLVLPVSGVPYVDLQPVFPPDPEFGNLEFRVEGPLAQPAAGQGDFQNQDPGAACVRGRRKLGSRTRRPGPESPDRTAAGQRPGPAETLMGKSSVATPDSASEDFGHALDFIQCSSGPKASASDLISVADRAR